VDTSLDQVILVDKHDRAIGVMPKLQAHQQGRCHRAISVIVRDTQGRLLLHQRAAGKYHSAGLWTNTCCSHPRPGEDSADTATRRLAEEMGIAACLTPLFSMRYRAPVSERLIEHEVVHVFGGVFDGRPNPDPFEVGDWCWKALTEIMCEINKRPQTYTIWFRRILRDFKSEIAQFARQEVPAGIQEPERQVGGRDSAANRASWTDSRY
jgi:isopentenyl-diphosphate delta-isomerase